LPGTVRDLQVSLAKTVFFLKPQEIVMKTRVGALVFVMGILCIGPMAFSTALDDYVAMPDANFSYSQYGSSVFDITTQTRAYVLRMTSQSWRGAGEVSPTVWTHWVTIIVPEVEWLLGPVKDTAMILINGGSIGEAAPNINPSDPTNQAYRLLAAGTRTVIVELRSVPNQPLRFSDETFSRSEDQIIAYSWDKFLRGGDAYWPVQLPMVKSAVRCMDAVQGFVKSKAGKTINHFVLTGGSKRGWTAWLTAAVDSRVTAIAPIVSDLLNMRRSFAHQWSCYGFWAEALNPYEQMGIFDWFDMSRTDELLAIVDPYEYRERLTLPKLIVTAAGDDFFVHDSLQFYIDGLPGETYVRTFPNTNHYLDGAYEEVLTNLVPYYDAFLNGKTRPAFSWQLHPDGSMTVTTGVQPLEVKLWQADNPYSRDFRKVTIGNSWTSTVLTAQSPGVYAANPGLPPAGWRSYFVEMVYDYQTSSVGIGDYDYHFTTEMRVVPEIRPFEADWSRDRTTDLQDLAILAENWLGPMAYYDMMPRRTGDNIINLAELGLFASHWLDTD
jgi:PhoPQ-activated pathogenicity-related protein